MNFKFSPITDPEGREALSWCYPPPYDLYNPRGPVADEQVAMLLSSDSPQWAVRDESDNLIGVIGTGVESQVPGGDYAEPAIDIGIHLRPECCGKGLGKQVVAAFIAFLEASSGPSAYRATIAGFNQRSLKTFLALGFTEASRFTSVDANAQNAWVILVRTRLDTLSTRSVHSEEAR